MRSAKDLEAEAARWIARLDRTEPGNWPDEFHQWLADDAKRRAAFTRLKVAWKRADNLRNLKPLSQAVDEDLLAPRPRIHEALWTHATVFGVMQSAAAEPLHRRRRDMAPESKPPTRWPVWLSFRAFLAAMLAVIVVSMSALVFGDRSSRVYETAVGGQEYVPLEDGSVASLNTNTRIRVKLTEGRREITLLRGEVLFTVAHDAARPFEVTAAGVTARAMGTEFSMQLREDGRVETVVREGQVAMFQPERLLGVSWRQQEIHPTLHAGDRALVDHRDVSVTNLGSAEIRRRLAWTLGRAVFRGATGAEIAKELNRYSQHRITVTDPKVASRRFGGSFDTTHPESFAYGLTQMFGAGTFVVSE
jgi:transmembrane sensor